MTPATSPASSTARRPSARARSSTPKPGWNAWATLDQFERSYFYSDSQNDIPLLERVTDPIATNPNDKLLAHAQARGWPVLNLFADGHAQ
jgi:hypothetical protein